MFISTGIVADSSVNCDDAVQVGQTAIAKMMGKTYAKLTIRRKDKVKSFGAMKNTVRVRGEDVVVNPSLLFNRITCILNTTSELDVFLQYELAPQPPALFVDVRCEIGEICPGKYGQDDGHLSESNSRCFNLRVGRGSPAPCCSVAETRDLP